MSPAPHTYLLPHLSLSKNKIPQQNKTKPKQKSSVESGFSTMLVIGNSEVIIINVNLWHIWQEVAKGMEPE